MVETMHTQGPWRWTRDNQIRDGEGSGEAAKRFSGELIATIGQRVPEAPHNARLIAASPDLLAALKQAVEDPYFGELDVETQFAIKRAVAAATGGAAHGVSVDPEKSK